MEIKFKHYYAKYNQRKDSQLLDIDFEIKSGDMVSIIGPSGAGKTTIFNAFFGDLIKERGDFCVDDENIENYNKKQRKELYKRIGFLSQETNLIPTDDVYTSILRIYKFPFVKKQVKEKIYSLLKQFNMFEYIFTRISELSGGQKQKIELIKLILINKDLILADEPTNSLDPESSVEFLEILKKLNSEKNITIVTIIHDISLAKKYFKKFIAIKNGKMVFKGKWSDFDQKTYDLVFKK
ncbi:ATP-binding cassette domain-containing protein [Mycoplasma zalophi]|uniref:ATP-binding cassette domain-containing protein n=1 Tax=Mycoplasma zalophi TaxID=191287 RepID=A0ABS6DP43_9MOLU|nr:ATP-binding cassette domain-containing protein [Mycoplasma zalophi]MBU4691141.1 ATP-binding cassette domain-containing protein [Mycoplasma zalophi]MBU4692087.1 ATP-binding cassette domain-containing protein [Mycoplasma zalophi]